MTGNRLGIEYDMLTGEVIPPIVDKHTKEHTVMLEAQMLQIDLRATVAVGGVASCFYANAVSYVAVFVALAGISRSNLVPRPIGSRAKGNLRAAVAYVSHRPDVRRPLVVMAVVGLVALNFQTTFPFMYSRAIRFAATKSAWRSVEICDEGSRSAKLIGQTQLSTAIFISSVSALGAVGV